MGSPASPELPRRERAERRRFEPLLPAPSPRCFSAISHGLEGADRRSPANVNARGRAVLYGEVVGDGCEVAVDTEDRLLAEELLRTQLG